MKIRARWTATGVGAALWAASSSFAYDPTVKIGHDRVSPAEITVSVGAIVRFLNEDEMPGGHSIVADDGSFGSPPLGKGGGWQHLFTEPGEYRYHIREHPAATGRIIVVRDAAATP